MEQDNTLTIPNEGLEALADVSHEIWSHWMKYMFSTGTFNHDGTWTMPADKAERWVRQMTTPYDQLSEQEKRSDRSQALKIVTVMRAQFVLYLKREQEALAAVDKLFEKETENVDV